MYIGISKALEDLNTGAVAAFHKISSYNVDLRNNVCSIVVHGWVDQAKHDAGKQILLQHNLSIQGLPPSDAVVLDWMYESLTAPQEQQQQDQNGIPIGLPPQANVFASAALISQP